MSESDLSLAEVRARRKAIAAEDRMLAGIEQRLVEVEKDWNTYRAAFVSHAFVEAPIVQAIASEAKEPVRPRRAINLYAPGKPPTKNALIVEALSAPNSLWQTANDIKAYIERQIGAPFKMSSLSPALTALKNSETIVRDELSVALVERVKKEGPTGFFDENEPPAGKARDGSELQP